LGLLTYYVLYRASNSRAIRRLEASARSKHEPLNLAQLATNFPPISENQNAAVALLAIWEQEDAQYWGAFRSGQRPLPERRVVVVDPQTPFIGRKAPKATRRSPLTADGRRAAEAYLKQYAGHLESARRALARPRCRFPVDVNEGLNALLPHLAEMKTEAQRFRVAGLVALETGDFGGAIHAVEDTSGCAKALAEEPFLIGQLVRLACAAMVLQDLERLLSRRSLSGPDLEKLGQLIASLEIRGALHDALVAERASALAFFDSPEQAFANSVRLEGKDSEPMDPKIAGMGVRALMGTGIGQVERRFLLEKMEEAIALSDALSSAALDQWDNLFERISKDARRFPPKIFSGMLLPALGKTYGRYMVFEARRRAALTSIGIEKCRLAHNGQLPVRLEEVTPEFLRQIPLDPFDGNPLRFKRLDQGYVVYSVGSNREDDGGKEKPEKNEAKDFDETFVVER
jgi:hypothetical protein